MSSSKPGTRTDVLALVIRYARARVRSTREAAAYLASHGIAPRTASHALARARLMGLLDDRVCARLWAETWARQNYAAAAIRQKLEAKGLEAGVVAAALRALEAEQDDRARARDVIARRLRRRSAHRAQLARALASRGFDADVIEQVLGEPFER